MSTEIQLKPCPFCGGKTVLQNPAKTKVICPECGACGPVFLQEGDNVTAWNTRAADSDHAARVAELEKEKDALRVAFAEASHSAGPTAVHVESLKASLTAAQDRVKSLDAALRKLDAIYRTELDEPAIRPDWLVSALNPEAKQ